MRIALLGGTFNPVHIGHLALADDVHISLGYDRILLVPANIPPHKVMEGGTASHDRLEMLRRAVAGVPFLDVEDCELVRGGLSYTIDTVNFLEQKYASSLEGKIGLIIGNDLVSGFSLWRNADALSGKTDIIIANRPGSAYGDFPYPFIPLSNPLLSISSSDIRSNITGGKSWRYLVPEAVFRYIIEYKLYEY